MPALARPLFFSVQPYLRSNILCHLLQSRVISLQTHIAVSKQIKHDQASFRISPGGPASPQTSRRYVYQHTADALALCFFACVIGLFLSNHPTSSASPWLPTSLLFLPCPPHRLHLFFMFYLAPHRNSNFSSRLSSHTTSFSLQYHVSILRLSLIFYILYHC